MQDETTMLHQCLKDKYEAVAKIAELRAEVERLTSERANWKQIAEDAMADHREMETDLRAEVERQRERIGEAERDIDMYRARIAELEDKIKADAWCKPKLIEQKNRIAELEGALENADKACLQLYNRAALAQETHGTDTATLGVNDGYVDQVVDVNKVISTQAYEKAAMVVEQRGFVNTTPLLLAAAIRALKP